MLEFDPDDPYPLLRDGTHSYAEEQLHSDAVDAWLGLETTKVEDDLLARADQIELPSQERRAVWLGLPVRALLTPYSEIRGILQKLNPAPGSTVVDLGAGYGRMGFVIARHYPAVGFVGYEVVEKRVLEGQRRLEALHHPLVRLVHVDLGSLDFVPQAAEFYFLYDYGKPEAIEKTLQDLRQIARERRITVVGRGRRSRDIIERGHPWLSQVISPEHFAHYSIYRST